MKKLEKVDTFCLLDKVFKERTEYIKYSFGVYNKIYSLPTIKYKDEVSEELFNYVKHRKYFLLLSVYDDVGRIYLERNVQEKLYWSLPGGSIHKNEDFHTAVKRIASGINGGSVELMLGEVEPVAFIENEFKFNGQSYVHYGIAFMARVRKKGLIETENTNGSFVYLNENELNNINRFANKEVARLCNKIKCTQDRFPELEVSTNENYRFRYFIHNNFIKRFILTPRLKKKEAFFNLIDGKINGVESFLDISCGDSDVLKQLVARRDFNYVVGNDISWSQIGFISKNSSSVVYTNHNSVQLPFNDDSFDVSYCGNTLHHMSSREEMRSMLDSALRVSKKLIIVEIEKPKNTGILPYILNKYWYQKYLGDVGGSYLSKNDFHSILETHFSVVADIKFDQFKNIQGRYLIAEITKKEVKSQILEVEEKFLCSNNVMLEKTLIDEGFAEVGTKKEIDNYYSDLGGDFVRNRTCLRIRTTGDQAEITHKGKSYSFFGSFAKVEHNVFIPMKLVSDYNDIFNSLGFCKYVTVNKTRHIFVKRNGIYNLTVAMDSLSGVGEFVEFEVSCNVEDVGVDKIEAEIILKKIIKIFSSCGLKPADLPYRDYVANYLSDKFLHKDKTKTILFDLDGTLIPTERPFYESFKEVVSDNYGEELTIEEYRDHEMSKDGGLIKYLVAKGIKILDEKIFMDEVYLKYNLKLEKLLSSSKVSNSFNAVNALKKAGYRIGLVTTSRRSYVDKILSALGNEKLFEQIVTREDVTNKKPDPESYNLILAKMHESPDNCLAVEDSARGLQSARGANLNCVLVAEHTLLGEQGVVNYDAPVFDNITQIFMLLSFVCILHFDKDKLLKPEIVSVDRQN
jgi:predicted adenylyl cyclase CyaB